MCRMSPVDVSGVRRCQPRNHECAKRFHEVDLISVSALSCVHAPASLDLAYRSVKKFHETPTLQPSRTFFIGRKSSARGLFVIKYCCRFGKCLVTYLDVCIASAVILRQR